jgi:nucleolar protein 53
MPRFSAAQLTSSKILAQRSAVPAVFSRTTTTASKRKRGLSREEKDRLMRIAKRPRKGPFNSIMDPSEYAAGSGTVALSAAVENSGKYDPWITQPVYEVKDGLETVQEKKIRVCFFNSSFQTYCLTFPVLASHPFYISQET